MSWDYGLYHKFRFYWLDFNLDEYEDTEIGRHLRRQNDDIERYKLDMTDIFSRLSKSVKNSGRIALINAPSIVHGQLVDTNEILSECANEVGWKMDECVESIDIPGPHHGMYGSLEKEMLWHRVKPEKRACVNILEENINDRYRWFIIICIYFIDLNKHILYFLEHQNIYNQNHAPLLAGKNASTSLSPQFYKKPPSFYL